MLTPVEVDTARRLYKKGHPMKSIARRFRVPYYEAHNAILGLVPYQPQHKVNSAFNGRYSGSRQTQVFPETEERDIQGYQS